MAEGTWKSDWKVTSLFFVSLLAERQIPNTVVEPHYGEQRSLNASSSHST